MSKKFINWSYGISAILVLTGSFLKINHFKGAWYIILVPMIILGFILSLYNKKLEKEIEKFKKEENK